MQVIETSLPQTAPPIVPPEKQTAAPPIVFSSLLKRYTLAEFWELPEPPNRQHYELIEGVLFTMPPPKTVHDDLVSFISESLTIYLVSKNRPGKIYHPRASIYVDDVWGTYLEPDMMYVSNELRETMGERRVSADIVFEFLSESTGNYDRTTKADTYLALGVKELWLIDSDNKTVEIRNADTGADFPMWQRRLFAVDETAESTVLDGWQINAAELFETIKEIETN